MVIGFSQNVGRPASTAWRMSSAWVTVGEVMTTASTAASSASTEGAHADAQLAGDRRGAVAVGVGDEQPLDAGMPGEHAGVERADPTDADDADAHGASSRGEAAGRIGAFQLAFGTFHRYLLDTVRPRTCQASLVALHAGAAHAVARHDSRCRRPGRRLQIAGLPGHARLALGQRRQAAGGAPGGGRAGLPAQRQCAQPGAAAHQGPRRDALRPAQHLLRRRARRRGRARGRAGIPGDAEHRAPHRQRRGGGDRGPARAAHRRPHPRRSPARCLPDHPRRPLGPGRRRWPGPSPGAGWTA